MIINENIFIIFFIIIVQIKVSYKTVSVLVAKVAYFGGDGRRTSTVGALNGRNVFDRCTDFFDWLDIPASRCRP